MKKKTQRVLVTGGAGFIGSHLVESLLNDHFEVWVVDNLSTGKRENVPADAKLFIDDIRNPEVINTLMSQVDACYHLAAVASVIQCETFLQTSHQTNLVGTLNVFDAAKAIHSGKSVPVVYASSAAVYGDLKDLPVTEDMKLSPISAYGVDKLSSELHARVASLVHGVPTMGFRFFNVYGPRQDPMSAYSGVISIFMEKISKDQPLTIYGDGQQSRDFIFVGDVVQFLRSGMAQITQEPRFYNVCTGNKTTILELSQAIMKLSGNTTPVLFKEQRTGDIQHSLGSPAKAQKELGLKASTSLDRGLSELWDDIMRRKTNCENAAGV